MRRKDREVTDRTLISGMLDIAEILHIAINSTLFPYIVPVNFGFEWQGDELVFYFHSAKEGRKLDLLRADPHIAVNAAAFVSYAEKPYRGHLHDYRSVTAFGVAEELSPDSAAFLRAHEKLLEHNRRSMQPGDLPVLGQLTLWQIRCRAEDVTAKAEIVPQTAAEIPFATPE